MADHPAADFDNRHGETVDAALHEGAIVHTEDGTALIVTRLDNAKRVRTIAHWAMLLHHLQGGHTPKQPEWFHHLDADDQKECVHELWECLAAIEAETAQPDSIDPVVAGWRAAGTALADSDQRDILLGNITVDDFVEVARPAVPLYVDAVSALADDVLTGSVPKRRAVRRAEEYDRIRANEEEEFDTNSAETPRHHRDVNGTVWP